MDFMTSSLNIPLLKFLHKTSAEPVQHAEPIHDFMKVSY